jgi:lysophospholipase L1-like esterase
MSNTEPVKSKPKKGRKTLIFLLVVFVLQEVVIRIVYPLPELANFNRINYMVANAEEKGAEYLRNETWTWQSAPDTSAVFEHYMNHYGFRDSEWTIDRPERTTRAFFIGDSFVEGLMANQDETIPEGFKKASGDQNLEVFNGGMLGVGLDSYAKLLADAVPIFKPDVVFICIYANDLGKREPIIPNGSITPQHFPTLRPRFLEVSKQKKTNGKIFPIWHDEARPFMVPSPSPKNPWTKGEHELKKHTTPALAEQMKSGSFNPHRINEFYEESIHLNQSPALGGMLPFIQKICTENGTTPIIVYIPGRNQVTDYYYEYELQLCTQLCSDTMNLTTDEYQLHQKVLAEECAKSKIQFIDLTDIIKTKEAKGEHLFWNYDSHMKGKGYLLLGETIWKEWKKAN